MKAPRFTQKRVTTVRKKSGGHQGPELCRVRGALLALLMVSQQVKGRGGVVESDFSLTGEQVTRDGTAGSGPGLATVIDIHSGPEFTGKKLGT